MLYFTQELEDWCAPKVVSALGGDVQDMCGDQGGFFTFFQVHIPQRDWCARPACIISGRMNGYCVRDEVFIYTARRCNSPWGLACSFTSASGFVKSVTDAIRTCEARRMQLLARTFIAASFPSFFMYVVGLRSIGRDEREGRVRAHADRGREIPVLPAAGLLLPGAGGSVLPPHLPRAGPGAFHSHSMAVP